MGMNYVFAPAFNKGTSLYGNAILSRFPILFWESFPLNSLLEPRVLLRIVIEVEGKRLNFFTTHLGLSKRERLRHIDHKVLPVITSSRRVIFMRFNCLPHPLEMQRLKRCCRMRVLLKVNLLSQSCPSERIDFVMHSGDWDSVQAQVHSAQTSTITHYGWYLAGFKLKCAGIGL